VDLERISKMLLRQLLEELEFTSIQGNIDIPISQLIYNSKNACKDGVFVCLSGANFDGHDYIPEVAACGVTAVITEKDVTPIENITIIRVEDTRYALACMSAAYFGHPARELTTVGITGTKGKTTTTYMIKSILDHSGIKTGLIGTIETIIDNKHIPAYNTTPESYIVQKYFREMVAAGCQCVVMEVSSQGLMLHRVSGFSFDYSIFTNLEKDHIGPNEHKDFADYIHCKSMLFRQSKLGIANIDDLHFADIMEKHTCEIESFGLHSNADIRGENIHLTNYDGKIGIAYHVSGLINFDVDVNIPGKFNVYNSLAAIALCRHFDIDTTAMKDSLSKVTVKGRLELVPVSNQFSLMIDYAHNAMALKSLLTTLKEYKPKRIVTLFGCGGNRDRNRRFDMGEISSKLSDLTVVTSDNPRNEEPMAIIEDILQGTARGCGEVITIPDRKEAIKYCIQHAKEGDVIILAGKGHEDYQEIKGTKYHMDERELIQEILKEM